MPLSVAFARTSAARNQVSPYNQRLTLSAVEVRLDEQLNDLTLSGNRYPPVRPIASCWRKSSPIRFRDWLRSPHRGRRSITLDGVDAPR